MAALAVAFLAAGCAESPTAPMELDGAAESTIASTSPTTAAVPNRAESAQSLIVCPTARERTATGWVTPLDGGVVSIDGHGIEVPAGAVTEPTLVTMTVLASRHLVLDIRANGEEHFEFERPAAVTIDYSDCPDGQLQRGFDMWVVDSSSWTLLENLGGDADEASATVTAETDHLSEFTVAT